jgi:hypothetical protein
VECSTVGIFDQVDALETGLPPMDQDRLPKETHEDDYDEEEVEDKKPFNPPCPPPWQQQHDD